MDKSCVSFSSRLILLAFLALPLVACGQSHMIMKDQKPAISAGSGATLVIIRTTSFGYGVTIENFLDGKFFGETRGRCYFLSDVPLGEHNVLGRAENVALARLNFEPGHIYFLSQGIYPGIWKARTGFSPLSAADAKKEMADGNCDYRVYDTVHPGEDMKADDYKEALEDFDKELKSEPERHKDTLNYKGVTSL